MPAPGEQEWPGWISRFTVEAHDVRVTLASGRIAWHRWFQEIEDVEGDLGYGKSAHWLRLWRSNKVGSPKEQSELDLNRIRNRIRKDKALLQLQSFPLFPRSREVEWSAGFANTNLEAPVGRREYPRRVVCHRHPQSLRIQAGEATDRCRKAIWMGASEHLQRCWKLFNILSCSFVNFVKLLCPVGASLYFA